MNPIAKLKREFRSNRFVLDVINLAGGTAIGQGIVVASMPIVTRLYSPSDMGVFGVFSSFTGFLGVGVCLCFNLAIVAADNDSDSDQLLSLSIIASVVTAIVSGAGMATMINLNILSFGILPVWSATLAVLMLVFVGIFNALRYWHVRGKDFKGVRNALVRQGFARALIPIVLAPLGIGWISLVFAEVIGRTSGIYSLFINSLSAIRNTFSGARRNFLYVCRRYWKYPGIVLPSSLADSLGAMLPLPLVASYFGVAAAGEFFLATRVITLPSALITASMSDVFFAHLSEAFLTDRSKVRGILSAVVKRLAGISLIIYLPIMGAAPFVTGVIFGEEWVGVGLLLSILTPIAIAGMIVSPLGRLLFVVNKSEQGLIIAFLRMIIPVAGMYSAYSSGLNFIQTMCVYSALRSVLYGLYLLVIWRASGHKEHRL